MKAIAFILIIFCYSGALLLFVNFALSINGNFDILFEKSYYQGRDFINDSSAVVDSLSRIINEYKSEEYVRSGATITENDLKRAEDNLYAEFRDSRYYNDNLTEVENNEIFKKEYAGKLAEIQNDLIRQELLQFNDWRQSLAAFPGVHYYATDGEYEFTNASAKAKAHFQTYPAYVLAEEGQFTPYPEEIKENHQYYRLTSRPRLSGQPQATLYVGFTREFISPRLEAWQQNKAIATASLEKMALYLGGLAVSFIYLVWVLGRKPGEEKLQFNVIDRIYNDINLALCFGLIGLWVIFINAAHNYGSFDYALPVTVLISAAGLLLILSLIKHLKNRTFLKHTLIYTIFAKLFGFIRDIYDSGSVAIKVIIVVIVYPLIAAATFFLAPITIGVAVWLAMKKVKEFQAVKDGVEKVKAGDIHYEIALSGNGEFAKLAADINSITDGFQKAIGNELKSERLKTELITNVSHDLRTPLTSIITYLDLLKQEEETEKRAEYLGIIEQKALRLKVLTEDLFEAAKASSGTIPVSLGKIDLVALLTQGLGELDERIKERELEFKFTPPQEKIYVTADGKLLWRAIENLLSNILKYALPGSRVYLDILVSGVWVTLTMKNISAYELNISSEELMERFVRGDAARSSQGSGLGLSIARSLLELQKGSFTIEVDGDLFKAVLLLPKAAGE
jgi:signal transduction histidine kinase